jgi:hypothetical protein
MASLPFTPSQLGGNPKGKQPMLHGHMDGGNDRAVSRKHLSRAFGNMNNSGLGTSPLLYKNNVLGPFRTAFNAGDVVTNNIEPNNIIYGRLPNQVGGNNLSRVQVRGDGTSTQNGKAMYSGNPKYVHDGSDYIRFVKLQALNKSYNDSSYGGAANSQSQHAINRVRK